MKRHNLILVTFISLMVKVNGQYSYNTSNSHKDQATNSSKATIDNGEIRPLSVGDKIPDLFLDEIINYKKEQAYLFSEFKGKLLILDFWGSFCAPCIAKFPELTILQEKFKEKLTILPIGIDGPGKGTIKRFINERKGTSRELKLPTVVINDVFNAPFIKHFPYSTLPHEIWINSEGFIIAITGAEAVNDENIKAIIEGKQLDFKEKKMLRNVDYIDPFLINSNREAQSNSRIFGSAFSKYNDSLFSYSSISQRDTTVMHLTLLNQTKQQFYAGAYYHIVPWLTGNSARKRILDSKTGLPLYFQDKPSNNKMNNWELSKYQNSKLFCYELILPKHYTKSEIYTIMIQDLDRYFGIKSFPSEKRIKCYTLSSKKNNRKIQIKNSQQLSSIQEDDSLIYYNGVSVNYFIDQLNGIYKREHLIVDQTGISDNINISIPVSANFDQLKKHLSLFDLEINEEELNMPVIIIEEISNFNSLIQPLN